MHENPENIVLRVTTVADAEALLAIYSPYVERTAVSFEYRTPDIAEFRRRIATTLEKYPYLVAIEGGSIIGYAYTGPAGKRAAYTWSVETSIYIRHDCHRHGAGAKLYAAIEDISRLQNVVNLYACVASTDFPDDHLTPDSLMFHRKQGYEFVGEMKKSGFKFGKWYSIVWMQKTIGSHEHAPGPFVPFPEVANKFFK